MGEEHNRMTRRKSLALPLALLVCIVTFYQPTSAFNTLGDASLRRLAEASSLSYLQTDKMSSSPYAETCKLEALTQVVDDQTESGATVFRDESSNTIVVACRGSANIKNFSTNLKFDLVPATRLSLTNPPEQARVHKGFQDASLGLWKVLSQPLLEEVSRLDSPSVIFTGHSLGGATALLCATHYTASTDGRPTVVTFGGPRLCNADLARFIRNEALRGCDVLHLVHSKDPILANNQKLWDQMGFENVGIEMECDPLEPAVYCEETPVKGNPFSIAWNMLDHCKYLGVFVVPRVV